MKYFFGFLISIGLLILVVILVIKGLSGGDPKEQPTPLSDYAGTSSVMQLTVSGPIVSDQQFQSYRVIVGRNQTTIETRLGYEGTVVDQRTYINNQESYTNFLRALDVAGFTKGDEESDKDERGMCANGDRYVMQIKDGSTDIQRYWSTTCRGQGNFGGNAPEVRKLFNAQIPQADFSKLTNSLKL